MGSSLRNMCTLTPHEYNWFGPEHYIFVPYDLLTFSGSFWLLFFNLFSFCCILFSTGLFKAIFFTYLFGEGFLFPSSHVLQLLAKIYVLSSTLRGIAWFLLSGAGGKERRVQSINRYRTKKWYFLWFNLFPFKPWQIWPWSCSHCYNYGITNWLMSCLYTYFTLGLSGPY